MRRKTDVRSLAIVLAGLLVFLVASVTSPAQTVVETINVGSFSRGVGVNPKTNRIYVSNQEDDAVSVIDGATNTVVTKVDVGLFPASIAVNPDTNKVYVITWYSSPGNEKTLWVIDGKTNKVVASFFVRPNATDVCVNPKTNMVYVTNTGDNSISFVDGDTNKVLDTWDSLGNGFSGIDVNPNTNMIYVANSIANSDFGEVWVIDGETNTLVKTIEVGYGPSDLCVNPATNKVYVMVGLGTEEQKVWVINGNTNKVEATVYANRLDGECSAICANPNTNKIYVTNYYSQVSVINGATNTVDSTVPVSEFPWCLSVNPATNMIYVGHFSKKFVSVVDGSSSPKAPSSFYFSEGYTGDNFTEYFCLGNPNQSEATANITYMFPDGSTTEETCTVFANSRCTVNVNQQVGPDKEVSIKVSSSSPNLVAERPVYFNYNGIWPGGHDVVGATTPQKIWYFAEGTTRAGFDEYVTVQNPSSSAGTLTFQYMIEGEGEQLHTETVGANSRATFQPVNHVGAEKDISLLVESDQNIVVERPMYFNYQGLSQNNWSGGHCVLGTNSPAKEWYFAEGTTRNGFEEWLCLQNPGSDAINVNAKYMPGPNQGGVIERAYTVPAKERLTLSVNLEVGAEKDVSVALSSGSSFIAERPIYFDYAGTRSYSWTGGHDVLGAKAPANSWFFAEGYTGANFEEWLCIQNPNDQAANLNITYYPESGTPINKSHTVGANERLTVPVNADAGEGLSVSAKVDSDQPIICERPIYFNFNGVWPGGHDVVGFAPGG